MMRFERTGRRPGRVTVVAASAFAAFLIGVTDLGVAQTLPVPIPTPSKPADPPAKAKPKVASSIDKEGNREAVATAAGPISVRKPVTDTAITTTLGRLLPKYPGVRTVDVAVTDGVVTLEGHVDDDDTVDEVTEFTRRVEGVRLVLNRMKTDAQVLSASQLALKFLGEVQRAIAQKWLLFLIAIVSMLASLFVARIFGGHAETLLKPFISNVLLRSVVGSLLSSFLVIGGILVGLSVLNLTQAVLSILGLAGVVGLAVGFAFRDIAENFIASILLGVRRPFRIGDYVQVAGQAGVVLSLNTRATVLATLEGSHIRIPNAIIYKEILINSSTSPGSRATFDVLIPYAVSTATALDAMTSALRDQPEVLKEPPARALVEALEPNGVRLRAYFWMPVQGVDGFKLQSDVKLKVKVALQHAGITPPPTATLVSVVGTVPVEIARAHGPLQTNGVCQPNALVTPAQAKANLQHDARAAESMTATPTDGRPTPVEQALSESADDVSQEGTNLLKNGRGNH